MIRGESLSRRVFFRECVGRAQRRWRFCSTTATGLKRCRAALATAVQKNWRVPVAVSEEDWFVVLGLQWHSREKIRLLALNPWAGLEGRAGRVANLGR